MKKLIALLNFLLLCVLSTTAQQVTSIDVIPSSPAPSDVVKALVTTSFPGGPCSRESQLVVPSNDTLIVSGFYCYLSGSGGCTSTDTFTLGTLTSGNHTIRLMLYTSNAPAACGSQQYSLKNIGLETFTVGTQTGRTIILQSGIRVYPNPSSGESILFSLGDIEASFADIKIFSLDGSIQLTSTLPVHGKIIQLETGDLPAGIYFCAIVTAEGNFAGKFAVSR